MIKLAFMATSKRIIRFTIDNRIINYYDDIWKYGIQILPMNTQIVRDLMVSRKENLKQMARLIREANTGKELEEYNSCKTDEELAEMIRKDTRGKGLMEIK